VSPARTAPPGARDQVSRLLTLVPYLHSRGTVSVSEAAAALGTTPAQVVRDLRVLFLCGLPGGYPDDLIDVDLDAVLTEEGTARADGLVRVGNAAYLARPLRLTPTEAAAVTVALSVLRSTAEPETVLIIDRTLAKLAAAGGTPGPGADLAAVVSVEGPPDGRSRAETEQQRRLESALREAVDRGVQVEIDYYTPARDEQTRRTVDPHRVIEDGAALYLDAWCHTAGGRRLFRLDRIGGWDLTDSPVTTDPPAPREVAAGTLDASAAQRVTLLLHPAAHWVTEYHPVEAVRPADPSAPPGSVEVDLLVADPRWLTRLLLRLAPNARVIDPPDHDTGLTAAAQAALTWYS